MCRLVDTLTVPKSIAKRIREEAKKLGITNEEYLIELITQGLDPQDRAREYIESAKELLEQAKEELRKGDVRQAAEKTWGSAALAIKAYAWWREGKRLTSHRELWEFIDRVASELGKWVYYVWHSANAMHTCFYEGWCTPKSVEITLEQVEKLVEEIDVRMRKID